MLDSRTSTKHIRVRSTRILQFNSNSLAWPGVHEPLWLPDIDIMYKLGKHCIHPPEGKHCIHPPEVPNCQVKTLKWKQNILKASDSYIGHWLSAELEKSSVCSYDSELNHASHVCVLLCSNSLHSTACGSPGENEELLWGAGLHYRRQSTELALIQPIVLHSGGMHNVNWATMYSVHCVVVTVYQPSFWLMSRLSGESILHSHIHVHVHVVVHAFHNPFSFKCTHVHDFVHSLDNFGRWIFLCRMKFSIIL